ncbi:cytochrome c-type biogenesis protein CcmF, partial [Klebsiella pneumoniae subsp. pneumoniae KPNIH23]
MPELGNFLLCLAAGLALLLSVYPLWGAARQDRRLMALARPLACGLFACIGGAFLLLVHAFVVNDFTVRYVAENSNSALPVWYRVAATWGRARRDGLPTSSSSLGFRVSSSSSYDGPFG